MVLNLVWFTLSVFLVTGCIRSMRKRGFGLDLTTMVAVTLLVVLLFPAISMTDDLMSMKVPAELRDDIHRYEFSPLHPGQSAGVPLLAALSFVALALSALVFLSILSARILFFAFASKLLAHCARALGIRGPSMWLLPIQLG